MPPRLAEDVACLVPVFPPGTRAKALLRRPVIPKLIGRLFLCVTGGRIAGHSVGIGRVGVIHG